MAKKGTRTRVGGLRGALLDPAVQEWLDTAVENKAALTPKQLRDRARTRATYDLPVEIIQTVDAVAKSEQCSTSGLVAVLLLYGLKLYSSKHLVIPDEYIHYSRSPRYEKVLRIPESDMDFLRTFLQKLSGEEETDRSS